MKYPSVSDLSLQGEEWEYVDGFGKRYMISNFGRVLSTEKFVNNHTGKIHKPNRILSQHSDSKGYKRTYLDMGDGKTRFIPVHRLVAIAFVPNPLSKPQVNHIDGNKWNNNLSNLEWTTCKENIHHAKANNLRAKQYGEHNSSSKLTEKDVLKIIELLQTQQYTGRQISKMFDVTDDYANAIRRKERWTYLTKDIDFN